MPVEPELLSEESLFRAVFEQAPAGIALIDSETGRFRVINVTDRMLARYRDAFEKLATDVERFCIKNEMGYVRAHTHVPFDDLVLGILRRGGVVG